MSKLIYIVDFIAFFGYSLCLLNLGINSNKSSGWEKILQNWENTGLFWIGKQTVFGYKIDKIKSLYMDVYIYQK